MRSAVAVCLALLLGVASSHDCTPEDHETMESLLGPVATACDHSCTSLCRSEIQKTVSVPQGVQECICEPLVNPCSLVHAVVPPFHPPALANETEHWLTTCLLVVTTTRFALIGCIASGFVWLDAAGVVHGTIEASANVKLVISNGKKIVDSESHSCNELSW
jgi:hypothetical protein